MLRPSTRSIWSGFAVVAALTNCAESKTCADSLTCPAPRGAGLGGDAHSGNGGTGAAGVAANGEAGETTAGNSGKGGDAPGGAGGAGGSAGRPSGRGGTGNSSASGASGTTAARAGAGGAAGEAGQGDEAGSAGAAGEGASTCAGYTFPTTCGGGCASWTFESGTIEGWAADTDPGFPVNGGDNNGLTNLTTSSTRAHDGGNALAVPGLTNGGAIVSVAVPVCQPGASTNLAGFTLSAWVYLTGTPLDNYAFVFLDAWGPSDQASSPVLTGDEIAVMNTWYQVTATFSSTVQADHVAIRLNPGMSWTGTMYIDTVTVTGP